MVVRIQLTVKHIRGHTFQIDADVESDVLGLKVQIWESQKIPIENQRLVFGGKELEENVKLAALGLGDNAVIYLVESNNEVPQQPQAEVTQVAIPIQSLATAPSCPIQTPTSSCNKNDKCVYKCPYRKQQAGETTYYEQFGDETVLSEERIQGVVRLGYWIRNYCILGIFVSFLCLFNCLYSIVPFVLYALGYGGTRFLNRCLLVFPLLISMAVGFGLTPMSIYWMIDDYDNYQLLALFIGLLHLIIFSCVCKFMCRISKLSCQEWLQARLRIRSRKCCRQQ